MLNRLWIILFSLSLFISPMAVAADDAPSSCDGALNNEFAPFPDPATANESTRPLTQGQTETSALEGFLTNSVPYTLENVLLGYRHSIFPFIEEGGKMHWFSFANRGVIDLADFKLGRSTRKALKKLNYTVTFNHSFREVVEACADSSKTINGDTRAGGDWITQQTIEMYVQLHEKGYAHSVEVWSEGPNGRELAGGLYGVLVDGTFFGESLFTRKSEASRLAFAKLVEYLQSKGMTWIDLQMVTEMTGSLGAKEIPREEFLQRLRKNQENPIHFPIEKFEVKANEAE